jgi:hypothetical protein
MIAQLFDNLFGKIRGKLAIHFKVKQKISGFLKRETE